MSYTIDKVNRVRMRTRVRVQAWTQIAMMSLFHYLKPANKVPISEQTGLPPSVLKDVNQAVQKALNPVPQNGKKVVGVAVGVALRLERKTQLLELQLNLNRARAIIKLRIYKAAYGICFTSWRILWTTDSIINGTEKYVHHPIGGSGISTGQICEINPTHFTQD